MVIQHIEHLGFLDLYKLHYVATSIRNNGSADATIITQEFSQNVYPETIQFPLVILNNQSVEIPVYINPVYPFDNTNEQLKLQGFYYDNNHVRRDIEIRIIYNYIGHLEGQLLRFDCKNIPYFADNLAVIIEYVPLDYTGSFSIPELVLLNYGDISVFELGKIYPLAKYVYAYIFNNPKLQDKLSHDKTSRFALINKNPYQPIIKRIIYRVI